jgi:hypothetical protein
MKPRWGAASLAAAVLLVTILVLGCGGGGDEDEPTPQPTATASGATNGAASPTPAAQPAATQAPPAATPTEAPPVLEQRESTAVPRAVRYADLTFTVTDAVVSNASLRTYDDAEPEVGEGWHLFLHITALNELTGRVLNFHENNMSLEIDGEKVGFVTVPGQLSQPSVQAANTVDYIAAFEVEEDVDFASITLLIAEPGTVPAVLPLSGEVPESGYPFEIEAEAGDYAMTSGPCSMTITPLLAEVDLDARIDGVGSLSAIDGSRRAGTDERFLRFDMRVTLPPGSCSVGNVQDQLFRLQIDGVPRGAINNVNFLINPGEASDFELLYRVPEDAEELVLLAGDPAGTVAEIPITAPSLSP